MVSHQYFSSSQAEWCFSTRGRALIYQFVYFGKAEAILHITACLSSSLLAFGVSVALAGGSRHWKSLLVMISHQMMTTTVIVMVLIEIRHDISQKKSCKRRIFFYCKFATKECKCQKVELCTTKDCTYL